jgi:hypothetical protein
LGREREKENTKEKENGEYDEVEVINLGSTSKAKRELRKANNKKESKQEMKKNTPSKEKESAKSLRHKVKILSVDDVDEGDDLMPQSKANGKHRTEEASGKKKSKVKGSIIEEGDEPPDCYIAV